MQFKQVTEDGIAMTVAAAPKSGDLYAHLMRKLDTFDMDEDSSRTIQGTNGRSVQVRIGFVKGIGTPLLVSKFEDQTVIYLCSVGDQTVGDGMLLSTLNAHQFAGALDLLAGGHLQVDDFEELEDLLCTFGLVDKAANEGEWSDTARLLEIAIEEAVNKGSIGLNQYKYLAKRLSSYAAA